MEVITIETIVWVKLNQRLTAMEELLLSNADTLSQIKKQLNQPKCTSEFIYLEDALVKYKISRQTIQNKVNKYKIMKQKRGKRTLLNEEQLINALNKKEPIPQIFKKQKAA
jgi:hypothetical protein